MISLKKIFLEAQEDMQQQQVQQNLVQNPQQQPMQDLNAPEVLEIPGKYTISIFRVDNKIEIAPIDHTSKTREITNLDTMIKNNGFSIEKMQVDPKTKFSTIFLKPGKLEPAVQFIKDAIINKKL